MHIESSTHVNNIKNDGKLSVGRNVKDNDNESEYNSNSNNFANNKNTIITISHMSNEDNSIITPSTTITALPAATAEVPKSLDDFYSKEDLSVYDDVNNNKLNLRSSNAKQSETYQTNKASSTVSSSQSDGINYRTNRTTDSFDTDPATTIISSTLAFAASSSPTTR